MKQPRDYLAVFNWQLAKYKVEKSIIKNGNQPLAATNRDANCELIIANLNMECLLESFK